MKGDDGAYQDADGVWRADNQEYWAKVNRRSERIETLVAIVVTLLLVAVAAGCIVVIGALLKFGAGLVP